MKYKIYWHDTQTKVQGILGTDDDDYPGDAPDERQYYFINHWAEGNYSCDCNRSIYFLPNHTVDNARECNTGVNTLFIDKVEDEGGNVLDVLWNCEEEFGVRV